ncbi:hypothetical protein A0H76_3014 [Hepatospora eriocheir]|uniref:Uncharacterized protein n=1 Tax=Hepatospora eriocheir TaxID=1081669 RepID=A0A1X0QIY7_9MICR|nr:hypothetical protein A0H76_3014 [Hepatospora eriocheir]
MFKFKVLLIITQVIIPVKKFASHTTVPRIDFVPTWGANIDAPLTYFDIDKIPLAVPNADSVKQRNIPIYASKLTGLNNKLNKLIIRVLIKMYFIYFLNKQINLINKSE